MNHTEALDAAAFALAYGPWGLNDPLVPSDWSCAQSEAALVISVYGESLIEGEGEIDAAIDLMGRLLWPGTWDTPQRTYQRRRIVEALEAAAPALEAWLRQHNLAAPVTDGGTTP